MRKIISLLLIFSLSTGSFAGRLSRGKAGVEFFSEFTEVLSHPQFLRMVKDQVSYSESLSSISSKRSNHFLRNVIRNEKSLKHKRRLARHKQARNRVVQDDNRMDVDTPSLGQIQRDLDAMDWMLTGYHVTGSRVTDENSETFNLMRSDPNQMDWMPLSQYWMDVDDQNWSPATNPFMNVEGSVLDTEMGESLQAFSGGGNFYDWVMGHEGDVIKLHGYGQDLAAKKAELEQRANYLNDPQHMHVLKQYYDDYTFTMICAGITDELSQLSENIHWMSYYLSSLEAKINWIMVDPSQEYQRYALHMHLEALEEQSQESKTPVFYDVPQPQLPEFQAMNTQDNVNELSTMLQRVLSAEIDFPESNQFSNAYAMTNSVPENDWIFSFQEITPVIQTPYVLEDPRVDKENVMNGDRQRAAQGSIPSVMRHTQGWMRSDVHAHEDELFNEVLAYLKSMLPQKHKFKRKESHLDEITSAIHALVGKTTGNDFPNFISPSEVTMRGGGAAITMKTLLARVWIAIKNHKDKHESENMKHSLIRALGNCIERDGHRVCAIGKTQRILGVLQGYVEGVDMDNVQEKKDVKPSNAPAGDAVKEEPKPEFEKFFNNFMITKNTLMQAIAMEPEQSHQARLMQVVQNAVDEVWEVYGDDAEKIKKTKERLKAFIDLTFDVEIDYEAIKVSPESVRSAPGSDVQSSWKQPITNAKKTLKKMVDKVHNFCVENAPKMTNAAAETISRAVQFLRGYAASLFASNAQ